MNLKESIRRILREDKLYVTPQELVKNLPRELKELLFKQWGAKQNPEWHPEGNTLKHILVVIKRAYHHYPDDPNMIMAALFHDLGKIDTYKINPKTGQPTAYGHEDKSTDYVEQFREWIESFEGTDVDEIKYLVKNHMKVKPSTWDQMKDKKKEPIKSHPAFDKLMGFTDKLDGGGIDLKESIRRIIKEESLIPLVIRRRVSPEDLEEAFDTSLEQNAESMNNPNSVIFKEKEGTTLWVFAKFVIDDMVTFLEQDYFNDEDRIYFSDTEEDDKTYHEKIRQPLLKHYGKRIKKKFNEVKSTSLKESVLKEENLMKPRLNKLLNILFTGFDDIYYDWANYNCGMGECCDPYAIGFVLPKSMYDDYLFKLVDDDNWEPNGNNYPDEMRAGLPEVCYEQPDIKNPDFGTIVFYEENAEEIENFLGPQENWDFDLLDLINEKFGCDATRIIFI